MVGVSWGSGCHSLLFRCGSPGAFKAAGVKESDSLGWSLGLGLLCFSKTFSVMLTSPGLGTAGVHSCWTGTGPPHNQQASRPLLLSERGTLPRNGQLGGGISPWEYYQNPEASITSPFSVKCADPTFLLSQGDMAAVSLA